MYKIILAIVLALTLNAEIIDGVAIVVKGKAITLYDIKKEMQLSHIDAKKASDILVRKALEDTEIQERGVEVSSNDVYEDIKKTAKRNGMSVSTFYEAVRNNNGLSSSELKKKIREKLLSQKLYASIAYSSMQPPSETEIKEYFELHKNKFSHPSSFTAIIYSSSNRGRLAEKINNPMLYAPDIQTQEQVLPFDKIAPELASILEKTPLNSFTTIIPNGQNGFISFYIKNIKKNQNPILDDFKHQIINTVMTEKREQVLGDYFAKLRNNADIKNIRTVE